MMRACLVGLVVLVGGPAMAAAQSTPAPAAEQQWLGTWEGTFQSDHAPPGPMQLVVARDSALRVTVRVLVGADTHVTEGYMVRLDEAVLRWSQEVMGAQCRGSAWIEQAVLRGQTECGAGGLSYSLVRVAATPPTGGW